MGRKTSLQLGLQKDGFLSKSSLLGRDYDAVFPLNYLLQPSPRLPDFFIPFTGFHRNAARAASLPFIMPWLIENSPGHSPRAYMCPTRWCQVPSPVYFAGVFGLLQCVQWSSSTQFQKEPVQIQKGVSFYWIKNLPLLICLPKHL